MAGGKIQDCIKDDQSEMPSTVDTGGGHGEERR